MSLIGKILAKSPISYAPNSGLRIPWTHPNNTEQQMQAMGSVGTLFAIVHRTSNATSQVEWKLWRKAKSGKKEDRVEVTSHLALDILDRPNPFMTRQEFVEAVQQHIDLTGEGWGVIARNPAMRSIPLELWPVRPDRMAPVPSKDDFIAGYVYTGPNGEQVPLETDSVMMLRMPNPLDPYRGMGPVQSILADIDSVKYSAEWNRNFFLNSAEPGGVIELQENLQEEEWQQFLARWNEQHKGVANAHRVAVIEHGKWVPRAFTQRDMQFAELKAVSVETIRGAFGMPKFAVGDVDDVNRATADASKAWFAEYLTVPRLERWKGMWNNDFLPLFGTAGKGLEFDYVSPVPENSEEENAGRTSRVDAATKLIPLGFTAESVVEAYDLPATLKFEKPEPPPPPVIAAPAPVEGDGEPPVPPRKGKAPPPVRPDDATVAALARALVYAEERGRRDDDRSHDRGFRQYWS